MFEISNIVISTLFENIDIDKVIFENIDKIELMTQCQDEFRSLSGCVTKILTAGRINFFFL